MNAAVFAKLNDIRLRGGKPPLGFLNPFLYKNAGTFNDVATGRIARTELAALLVSALLLPQATGKTFEALSLPGVPTRPLDATLVALPADSGSDGPPPDPGAYEVLKQLAA